jgi:hypothetical protein
LDDTNNETTEAPDNEPQAEGPEGFAFTLPMRGLTTAEGVGALLDQAAEFVGERMFAQTGFVLSPKGDAVPAILKPDGSVSYISQSVFDAFGDNPRFRRGAARMTSLDSFIAHVNRFGDEDSVVFACDSRSTPSLTAVLDYHRADTLVGEDEGDATRAHGEYRHGLHRTEFAFPLSDEWKAWTEANNVQMSMVEFALFIENHMGDIALVEDDVPESAKQFVQMLGGPDRIADVGKLIDLSTGLRINEDAVIEEAVTLSSGEGRIRMSSEHTAAIGQTTITVPTMFFIAIPVFRNGAFYRIPARLRYRKTQSGLKFSFALWREDRVFDHAFTEAVDRVALETGNPVLLGSPE